MRRSTKTARLVVELVSGVRLSGLLHVDGSISSSVRPSDALRDNPHDYIVLSEASVTAENGHITPVGAVLVRVDAIGFVELRDATWKTSRDNE